jgi:hypothetical protein
MLQQRSASGGGGQLLEVERRLRALLNPFSCWATDWWIGGLRRTPDEPLVSGLVSHAIPGPLRPRMDVVARSMGRPRAGQRPTAVRCSGATAPFPRPPQRLDTSTRRTGQLRKLAATMQTGTSLVN